MVGLLLLAACTPPGPDWASGIWEGNAIPQGESDGQRWTLRLFHVGSSVTGSWSSSDASGTARGSIRDASVSLELIRNEPATPACTLAVILTHSDDLTGSYTADPACLAGSPALGVGGSLLLSKRRVR